MKQIFLLIYLFILLCMGSLHARSVVYNFRIAQITKEHIFENANSYNHTIIGLLFDEISERRYDDIHRNYFGALGSFIYNYNSFFFRTDFAVSLVQQKSFDSKFSDTQTDDFLFTIGKNLVLKNNFSVNLSGLFGVPTHEIYALKKPEFGVGQFGFGVQLDGAYKFNEQNYLILGSRYIYFIPRSARDEVCNKFKFTQGNSINLLIANKSIWGKHGLELGFTPGFLFGAKIDPFIKEIVEKTNYIRTSWYAVYQYKFLINKIKNRFLFNIASGFDVAPKQFGHKYIVFLWAAWDIKF
ncbi:MAG: hypothetical protein K2X90_01875 [Candidatus Babeliaceae bacterium]|nr:hypothetical protein [Candidatus Babeliaceae bacterium]